MMGGKRHGTESVQIRKALKLSLWGPFLIIKSLPAVPFIGPSPCALGMSQWTPHRAEAWLSLCILQDLQTGASQVMDAHPSL